MSVKLILDLIKLERLGCVSIKQNYFVRLIVDTSVDKVLYLGSLITRLKIRGVFSVFDKTS